MYAMQYSLTLPADYDMQIIRERVATHGHRLDDFPGLGFKAYCIRERGQYGSSVNQYAPFYVWDAIEGMNRFLWGGGGFSNIIDSFGRPPVETWTGIACQAGPSRATRPRMATRHTEALPPDSDPRDVVERELARLLETATLPGVHTAVLALDPMRWELLRFMLWEHDAPAKAGCRYEVLHLSAPGLAALRRG